MVICMNIGDFFSLVGGDYSEVSARLVSEKLILKYVKRFVDDAEYDNLISAIQKADVKEAFRAAHTLKGNCATLGLCNISRDASVITEILRNADEIDYEKIENALTSLKESYESTINAIKDLD